MLREMAGQGGVFDYAISRPALELAQVAKVVRMKCERSCAYSGPLL